MNTNTRFRVWAVLLVLSAGVAVGDDGDIDLADLAQLLANYGETSGMVYEDGDLNAHGDVDLTDPAGLLGVYGTTCP